MRPAAFVVACGLVAAAWAAAAIPRDPGPPVHIHPGQGHAAAVDEGWLRTEFSGRSMQLEVNSSPGSVTEYGAVFSIMNHADVPVWFCLVGSGSPAGPRWTLHGDGLHWQSGQAGPTLVALAPGEERQVEVKLDWRDASAQGGPVGWSIVPLGEPGCRVV